MTRPLILAYGNPLRQDDGLGLRAGEIVAARMAPGAAEISWHHQLTPELACAAGRARVVLFLDASAVLEPGRVRCRRLRPGDPAAFTHHMPPAGLLALAEQLYGKAPPAFLISGGVSEMNFSDSLSAVGERCAARMAALTLRLLAHWAA